MAFPLAALIPQILSALKGSKHHEEEDDNDNDNSPFDPDLKKGEDKPKGNVTAYQKTKPGGLAITTIKILGKPHHSDNEDEEGGDEYANDFKKILEKLGNKG
jgi:hypothetical protein